MAKKVYERCKVIRGNEVMEILEKPLYSAGAIKNLFKDCNHIEIISRSGEKVRDLRLYGDKVHIDPGEGDHIFIIDANSEMLFEPWVEDYFQIRICG